MLRRYLENPHVPSNRKENNGNIGIGSLVTNGYGDGSPDIRNGGSQGIRPVRRMSCYPNNVTRLLGPLTQGG